MKATEAHVPTAVLTPLDHDQAGPAIALDQLPAVLGRAVDADVVIVDRWASRRHCQIEIAQGTLYVRDLGSKNGTWVNMQKVDESPLLPGDRLSIGSATFSVSYDRGGAARGELEQNVLDTPQRRPDSGDSTLLT